MSKDKAPGSLRKGGADRRGEVEGPTLPYARAFVVQFSADTDARLKHAAGRVEHLQTGTRRRFTSIESLRTIIAAMLAGGPSAGEKPAGSRARSVQLAERPAGPGVDAPTV